MLSVFVVFTCIINSLQCFVVQFVILCLVVWLVYVCVDSHLTYSNVTTINEKNLFYYCSFFFSRLVITNSSLGAVATVEMRKS